MSADSSYGLEAVVLTLHHERVSDIKITLEAPDRTSVWLTNRNGKDTGRHYLNTRFSQFGKNGQISASSAPFKGDFVPDGLLEFVNNGQNPNGLWKISVEDLKEGVTGRLDKVQLIFSNKPAALVKARFCSLETVGFCACPDGKENCELLPDLVIVPVFTYNQIQEYSWNHKIPVNCALRLLLPISDTDRWKSFGQTSGYAANSEWTPAACVPMEV